MIHQIRAVLRFFFFFLTMAFGILMCLISSLFGGDALGRNMSIRRSWLALAVKILGLHIEKDGQIEPGIFLYASNHRSFADPMVALLYIKALPLAKAEVNQYPLVGFGARLTGILFVKRENVKSRATARNAIQETLEMGRNVLIYPEGTTTTEECSQLFKGGSFEVAADIGIPVVPIAIEYEDPADHWSDTSIWWHYKKQFGKRVSRCKIAFGPSIRGSDGLALREEVQAWIDDRLLHFRAQYDQK